MDSDGHSLWVGNIKPNLSLFDTQGGKFLVFNVAVEWKNLTVLVFFSDTNRILATQCEKYAKSTEIVREARIVNELTIKTGTKFIGIRHRQGIGSTGGGAAPTSTPQVYQRVDFTAVKY